MFQGITPIDDLFPSCRRTYATLAIYHDYADPSDITRALLINPDRTQQLGKERRPGKVAEVSAWFLSSQGSSKSNDLRVHLSWILDQISPHTETCYNLIENKFYFRIYCFWESESGNGGPVLDREIIHRLSTFPGEVHFDIWLTRNP